MGGAVPNAVARYLFAIGTSLETIRRWGSTMASWHGISLDASACEVRAARQSTGRRLP